MFQVGMSRPLTIAAVFLVTLAGCATPSQPALKTTAKVATNSQIQNWLELQREVSAMSIEEVDQRLAELGEPKGPQQLFYFGLLNQQLDAFTKWTQARDIFRQLDEDTSLDEEQRSLAAILERYNQSRINWYLQRSQLLKNNATLQAELGASREENTLLEQKLKAITDLETSISTRMEK